MNKYNVHKYSHSGNIIHSYNIFVNVKSLLPPPSNKHKNNYIKG